MIPELQKGRVKKMIAYKGTRNLQCKDLICEVGKTYTWNKNLEIEGYGFHFCKSLNKIEFYYPFNKKENIYLEIEVLGDVVEDKDICITNKFKVLRIIPKEEFHLIDPEHFDENGNLIYHESSGSFWWKKEYDENNNLIYFENSDGYWCKKEYDENNNEIYSETSNATL